MQEEYSAHVIELAAFRRGVRMRVPLSQFMLFPMWYWMLIGWTCACGVYAMLARGPGSVVDFEQARARLR